MDQGELIPHLFRTEFRKIASVLCRRVGIGSIEIAEDIASETFQSAVENWPFQGIPDNPVAWLYRVAKNKALNHKNRRQLFADKIASEIKSRGVTAEELDFSDQNIADSQLVMLFVLCHPSIPTEGQIGLSLRILCGFGIEEIANAFLTNKETVNKRLGRAREKLRHEKIAMELPAPNEVDKRLDSVLKILYLLFSEGYYSESRDELLRKDLCLDAMRLTNLLIENAQTNRPEVNALMALMCFHASRFEARLDHHGRMVLYDDQDEDLWNKELIAKGAWFLHQSSQNGRLTKYHLEATIAYWHTLKTDSDEKWNNILQLYNHLLMVEYSPIAALNRTYAVARVKGKEDAIREAEKLQLTRNHFYYTLLGELYKGVDNDRALENLQKALSIARTKTDRQTIRKAIDRLSL